MCVKESPSGPLHLASLAPALVSRRFTFLEAVPQEAGNDRRVGMRSEAAEHRIEVGRSCIHHWYGTLCLSADCPQVPDHRAEG